MCNQCEACMINGVYCHEHGCPNAWKDHIRECKWCGQEFEPETEDQQLCSEDCARGYYG